MNKKIYELLSTETSVALSLALGLFVIVCTDITTGLGLGLLILVLLLLANVIFGLISKIVPNEIAFVIYLILVSTLVILSGFVVSAYVPTLANQLTTYYPLAIFTILFLSKGKPLNQTFSFSDLVKEALSLGGLFLVGAISLGCLRQLLGTGILSITNPFNGTSVFTIELFVNYAMPIFTQLTGGFVLLACLIAGYNGLSAKKGDK